LVTAKFGKVGPCKFTVEETVEFRVLGCRLAVRNLETVGLQSVVSITAEFYSMEDDIPRCEVAERTAERVVSSRGCYPMSSRE